MLLKFLQIVLISMSIDLGFDDPWSAFGNRDLLSRAAMLPIATLTNGNYQFYSDPPPNDWRTGAGICFNFTKFGDRVSGYYGYPNTDDFICVRGKIKRDLVTGEALMTSWLGREWTNIPKTAFKWDEEGHLLLKDGKIIRTAIDRSGRINWISFRSATLDLRGFYQSIKSSLISPTQLCKWN